MLFFQLYPKQIETFQKCLVHFAYFSWLSSHAGHLLCSVTHGNVLVNPDAPGSHLPRHGGSQVAMCFEVSTFLNSPLIVEKTEQHK